jgi:DNA-binding response OmpR family regulator
MDLRRKLSVGRVLVLEPDPVIAAVLEDRLHVAGHQVALLDEPARAVSTAAEGHCDLVILAMELQVVPGLEVVRSLKRQPETRAVPILALSKSNTSADRLTALKAGVDEFLTRPVDLEELIFRADRLLGNRGESPAVLAGDLVNHPVWELAQYLQQAGKSGDLIVHGQRGSGQLQVDAGRITTARFQKLQGRDAVLAILDMKEGNFRLTTAGLPVEEAGAKVATGTEDSLPIPEALMQSAWLEDQIRRRSDHLPATGVPLEALAKAAPEAETEELQSVPISKIFDRIQERPGIRIYDLLIDLDEAPPKIRLAVAWLIEQGAIAPTREATTQSVMNTREISSSVVLDVAIHNLLASARDANLDTGDLPYLVLMEPGVWPQFKEQLESLPGFNRIQSLTQLVNQVDRRRGGSASFKTEYGTLSLHLQILETSVKAQVENIVAVCAGVMLWLEKGEEQDLILGVIERLAGSKTAVGVLVATSPEAQKMARDLVANRKRWRVSNHAPRSLIGILRLLYPRAD